MASDEVLYRLALVNGVLVPDQYNGARHMSEQMRKKSQHFLAAQIAWVRVDAQAKFDPGRRDQQRPQQIKAHAMRETGVDDRRMSLRCPGALERRDQREAAFVLKHQGGVKLAPFFLSGANDSVSTAPRRARRAAGVAAGVFANSSPSASTHARPHWDDSASQTNATANGRCGRASSNLRRSPELPPHLPTDAVSGLPGVGLVVGDVRASVYLSAAPALEPFGATASHCALSLPTPRRLGQRSCRAAATPALAGAEWRVLRLFLLVAYPISCHLYRTMDISYSKLCS